MIIKLAIPAQSKASLNGPTYQAFRDGLVHIYPKLSEVLPETLSGMTSVYVAAGVGISLLSLIIALCVYAGMKGHKKRHPKQETWEEILTTAAMVEAWSAEELGEIFKSLDDDDKKQAFLAKIHTSELYQNEKKQVTHEFVEALGGK